MTREEILNGLACCAHVVPQCSECSYLEQRRLHVTGKGCDCTSKLADDALALVEAGPEGAVWRYYVNDEGKARWRCSRCGKLCRRDPREKRFCSGCGRKMEMEG